MFIEDYHGLGNDNMVKRRLAELFQQLCSLNGKFFWPEISFKITGGPRSLMRLAEEIPQGTPQGDTTQGTPQGDTTRDTTGDTTRRHHRGHHKGTPQGDTTRGHHIVYFH